jgi:hypothetical protein
LHEEGVARHLNIPALDQLLQTVARFFAERLAGLPASR